MLDPTFRNDFDLFLAFWSSAATYLHIHQIDTIMIKSLTAFCLI